MWLAECVPSAGRNSEEHAVALQKESQYPHEITGEGGAGFFLGYREKSLNPGQSTCHLHVTVVGK